MAENRFTILLMDDVGVDPRKFGALVAPALGVTQVEARMAVRKGRGIFLENLAEADAKAIAEELGKEGIRAKVAAAAELPALPAPRKGLMLDRGDDLLTWQDPGTKTREGAPWDAFLVVQVGVVAKPEFKELFGHVPFNMMPAIHKMEGSERELLRENLILKMEGKPADNRLRKEKKAGAVFEEVEQRFGAKVKVIADLITADLGLWLRVAMDDVAYLPAAGGVRMGGAWGFQMFADDLAAKCPAALTEPALKLLRATDIREHIFPQIEEYNRVTQWIAIKRTLWPDAATSSPSPEAPASPTDAASSSASPAPEPPSTSS